MTRTRSSSIPSLFLLLIISTILFSSSSSSSSSIVEAAASDYYKVLGIKRLSSIKEVNQAFAEIEKSDAIARDPEFQVRVLEAYEVLSDDHRKKTYDEEKGWENENWEELDGVYNVED